MQVRCSCRRPPNLARYDLAIRSVVGLAVVVLCSCPGSSPPLDLACDIIRHDPVRDVHRLAVRQGEVPDSALLRLRQGRLVVRGYRYDDPTPLHRPFRVVLVSRETGARSGGDSDRALVVLEPAAGAYSIEAACTGCSRAESLITVVAGRQDTVDAHLTGFPTNCEAERKRGVRPN